MGRREEALTVIAQTYANGDETNAVVLAQYQQIIDTIHYERETGETLSIDQLAKSPVAGKRITLALSVAIFSTVSGEKVLSLFHDMSLSILGNVIASYYLGTMLVNAGIVNVTDQLQLVRSTQPAVSQLLTF